MANERVWQKFCNDSTMHGFRELFYAKTLFFKLFWVSIIVSGICMTCYQIYQVLYTYNSSPTKTQIELLPKSEKVWYPPPSFSFPHWCDWANVTKFKEFKFDMDTSLYAMSFFNPLYTKHWFNVTEAKEKLSTRMAEQNISTVWDLGISISMIKPNAVYSVENYKRYFNHDGELFYILNGSSNDLESHEIAFKLFTNFTANNFSKAFAQLFNGYTFLEEYEYFKASLLDDNPDNESLISSMHISFNPLAGKSTYYDLELLTTKYKFYLRGTKYVWMSSEENRCEPETMFSFYTECEQRCNTKFKVFRPTMCQIYFLKEDFSVQDGFGKLENICPLEHEYSSAQESDQQQYQQCLDKCTSSCQQWTYEFNQALYPRQISVQNDYLKNWITLSFDHDHSFLITTLPSVMWYDAVANVGGLLGLWIGGSILSFIQLIYIFCCLPFEGALIGWRVKSAAKVAPVDAMNNSPAAAVATVSQNTETESRSQIEKLKAEIRELQRFVDQTGKDKQH